MNISREWFWISIATAIILLIYILAPALTPFFVAATLAYLFDPLVNKLQAWKIPRTLGVILVFFILFLLILGMILIVVPLLTRQLSNLLVTLPTLINWLDEKCLTWLNNRLGLTTNLDVNSIKTTLTEYLKNTNGLFKNLWHTLSYSGHTLLLWGTNLLLIPVVMFYLLRDWHKVLQGARTLIPRSAESTIIELLNECHSRLGGFLRGQLMVVICLSILYSCGLWLVGLNVAIVIGIVTGLISIIPYLGFIIGLTSACLAALVQFHDLIHIIGVVSVFLTVQSIEIMLLTPLFVGDRIGMHPVAVLFAILVGGQLFGFVGILLALPIAAILMVFIRYFRMRYITSQVYER